MSYEIILGVVIGMWCIKGCEYLYPKFKDSSLSTSLSRFFTLPERVENLSEQIRKIKQNMSTLKVQTSSGQYTKLSSISTPDVLGPGGNENIYDPEDNF